VIGNRLKLARSAAGFSLRELEAQLGHLVSAQAIGKYERDEMMPGSEVLMALATALGVSEDYLLKTDSIELVGVDFRKQRLDAAKERSRVESQILTAVERYLEIEDLLTLKSEWELPAGFPQKIRKAEDAEEAARVVRKAWKLGADPVPSLAEFLEDRAIKIVSVSLAERVSGVNATVRKKNGDNVQVIVLNADHAGERQRFTLAHELGHMLLQCASDPEPVCNRFAGAFLVPAEALRAELGVHRTSISMRELFSLKALFGVSVQALVYRAADLGIFNPRLKKSLFIQFGKAGWRKAEPQPVVKEQPMRFKRLCLRALSEDVISASKAAELLDEKTRDLLASLNEPSSAPDGPPPNL
jgi:Zn-dependent peptidase ImmA (M78 family)